MNPFDDELDAALAEKLDVLKSVPVRNPETAARMRADFLQQAQSVTGGVSVPPVGRHNGWKQKLQFLFLLKKERTPMFGAVATIILIVSLLFGGGGATLAMAQSSLPDQPLYGVKTAVEAIRMDLTANPDSRLELALKFADQRAEEIQKMVKANNVPPESVQARYQQQLEFAIQTALMLQADPSMVALKKVQTRLELHLQAFNQLGSGVDGSCAAVLARVRSMLQERLAWVETGADDPLKLQEQLRQRERDPQPAQPSAAPGGTGSQTPPGTGGGNPWTTGTPTPGSGYGPGPGTGDCTTCTPQSTGQGGNPWTTGTPTPGSGYGAPPTDDPGAGGGNGATAQPQPTSAGPGPGDPGGSGGKK